jgi:hypothetical protein
MRKGTKDHARRRRNRKTGKSKGTGEKVTATRERK